MAFLERDKILGILHPQPETLKKKVLRVRICTIPAMDLPHEFIWNLSFHNQFTLWKAWSLNQDSDWSLVFPCVRWICPHCWYTRQAEWGYGRQAVSAEWYLAWCEIYRYWWWSQQLAVVQLHSRKNARDQYSFLSWFIHWFIPSFNKRFWVNFMCHILT